MPRKQTTYREKGCLCSIKLKKKKKKKTEIAKKRSLKEEIEYRSGMYFGIKSGALYVRDGKSGNTEEILKQLQHDIIADINFLSRKTPGYV
jgi:hypothetical protein